MRITRWRNKHSWQIDKCPLFGNEVKKEKIIQLSCTIMTSEQIHTLSHNSSWCSVSAFRPKTVPSYFEPLIWAEVKSVKIISVESIVATENVHLVIINNCAMRMSWTWAGFRIWNLLEWPLALINTVLVEVVNSYESIIPAKNVNEPLV
jgi:hypothetical protein